MFTQVVTVALPVVIVPHEAVAWAVVVASVEAHPVVAVAAADRCAVARPVVVAAAAQWDVAHHAIVPSHTRHDWRPRFIIQKIHACTELLAHPICTTLSTLCYLIV